MNKLMEMVPAELYGSKTAMIADLILLAVLVLSVLRGYRKGFFKSLMGFVVLGAAVFAAVTVSNLFTDKLTEKYAPKVEEKVAEVIAGANLDFAGISTADVALKEDHPDTLSDAEMEILLKNEGFRRIHDTLEKAKIKEPQIRSIFAKTLKTVNSGAGSLEAFLTDAAQNASHTAFRIAVEILLMLLSFTLVSVLLKLAVNSLRRLMYRVKLIKSTDRFLGMLFGLLAALVVLTLAEYILFRTGSEFYQEALPQTFLADILHKHNPIGMFFF